MHSLSPTPPLIAAAGAQGLGRTFVAECPAAQSDCTSALQAALTRPDADTVLIPANRAVWPTGPLMMYNTSSNRRVVFEAGVTVEALKGGFVGGADSLLSCYGVDNVSFLGAGATLRMHKVPLCSETDPLFPPALRSDTPPRFVSRLTTRTTTCTTTPSRAWACS